MPFDFRDAVREDLPLIIGLAGASGSGKTYTALRLARGLGGTIAMIDTETRRGLHYAEEFKFKHANFCAPFTPERYLEAIDATRSVNPGVVIVDSASHEWIGEGGLHDIHSDIAQKMAKRSDGTVDYRKLEAVNALAWADPKMRHKKMVQRMLQSPFHLILCFRAEEKLKAIKERDERGHEKTKFVDAGWIPVCEKGMPYELTLSFTLSPETPGIPRFDLPHKVERQHRRFFPEGQFIDERVGEALGAWARGGVAQPQSGAATNGTDKAASWAEKFRQRLAAVTDGADLDGLLANDGVRKNRDVLRQSHPEISQSIEDAVSAAWQKHHPMTDDSVSEELVG